MIERRGEASVAVGLGYCPVPLMSVGVGDQRVQNEVADNIRRIQASRRNHPPNQFLARRSGLCELCVLHDASEQQDVVDVVDALVRTFGGYPRAGVGASARFGSAR